MPEREEKVEKNRTKNTNLQSWNFERHGQRERIAQAEERETEMGVLSGPTKTLVPTSGGKQGWRN